MRRGETRAILLPAFRHDLGNRRHCPIRFCSSCACAVRRKGAALVWTKSVRLRLSLHGSWEALGVRPDLCAWSKAIANGYALAAVTGNDKFRSAAQRIYITGSFWMGGVAMAAALATLDVLEQNQAVEHMESMGCACAQAWHNKRSAWRGVTQTVQPDAAYSFDDDADFSQRRCLVCTIGKGSIYIPATFVSGLANKEQDIDHALQVRPRVRCRCRQKEL